MMDFFRSEEVSGNQKKSLMIFILLGGLIFYPPLVRGLFFTKDIMIAHLLSFGLFTFYLIGKITNSEKIELDNPIDYIGLAFIVSYLLPIIFGQWVNIRDAVGLVLRYINVFVIYLMVKDYAQEFKYKKLLINLLILSGVVVSGLGILGATGYIHLIDIIMKNRIASTFQYPNTLAAFTMTLFFMTAGMQSMEGNVWKRNIYGISGFIFLFTFIFTYSRGAWLLFPIFALLYLLMVPKGEKVSTIFYYISVGLPNLFLLQPFTARLSNTEGTSLKSLLIFAGGIAVFLVLYNTLYILKQKLQSHHEKYIYIVLTLLLIVAVGVIVAAFNMTAPLTFDNTQVSENRTNQITRGIKDIEPLTSYRLVVDVESQSVEETQWPWSVRINGTNQQGENTLLTEAKGEKDQKGEVEIPFETLEDTDSIMIFFTNLYPKTKVTFNNAVLYDEQGNEIQNIKLRYQYIPEGIISRLDAINLTDNSSSARLIYYKDGMKMFKDHFLVGAGGGAWKNLFTMYQSEPYYSSEAHNFYLQTLVETGIVGILIVLLLLFILSKALWNAVKKEDLLNITLIVASFSLLAHSALDFNFTFMSMLIFLWVLMGLVAIREETDIKAKKRLEQFSLPTWLLTVMIVPLFLFTGSLLNGFILGAGGAEAAQSRDYDTAIRLYRKAISRDPLSAGTHLDMAELFKIATYASGDDRYLIKVEEHLRKGLKRAPYSEIGLQRMANFYMITGEAEKAEDCIQQLLKVAPLVNETYNTQISIYKNIADYYFTNGQMELAEEMYEKTIDVIKQVGEINERITKRSIKISGDSGRDVLESKYILESKENLKNLEELDDVIYMMIPDSRLSSFYKREWRKWNTEEGNVDFEVTADGIKVTNSSTNLGIVYSPNFSLQPNSTYIVSVVFDRNSTQKDLPVRILSDSGEKVQFTQNVSIDKLNKNTFEFQFKATDDVEPGNQYIRFDHRENSDNYFVINQIVIKEIKEN